MRDEEFITQIRELRKKTGLSQEEFSKEFKIPKRTLENWEEGQNTPTSYMYEFMKEHVERWLDAKK